MRKKAPRDVSQLSGKPLAETLERSNLPIKPDAEGWVTSADLVEKNLPFTPNVIYDLNVYLLTNPHLNSSCLFRGDILLDTLGILKTPEHEEKSFNGTDGNTGTDSVPENVAPMPASTIAGFELTRTVVRRFIPRNPKLDRSLDQTCHFYEANDVGSGSVCGDEKANGDSTDLVSSKRILFTMTPHVSSKDDIPFYHPLLRGLTFLYDFQHDSTKPIESGDGKLSIHFLPFPNEPIPTRLERTLSALLNSQLRLARNALSVKRSGRSNENPIKDNVIPRHRVQNTYSWLKAKYAVDLCQDWVEDTEPSKHVFEDLAITAFFIELWRNMYGVTPLTEKDEQKDPKERDTLFPGFVDVACGNGVLVYVLIMEGYQGWGFDARRRKSWGIFPESVQENLKEAIYIPKPFSDVITASGAEKDILDIGVDTFTGTFQENTFIISNHADELTVWTPLMAALSNPESPLPFLSIPCCSHSLSGARYRYPPPEKDKNSRRAEKNRQKLDAKDNEPDQNPQPQSGDLKALRAEKKESLTDAGMYNSTYGCLTAKTMMIAEEIGYEVERTLIRIPSTRNMGIIGGRRLTAENWARRSDNSGNGTSTRSQGVHNDDARNAVLEQINEIVYRECSREGGIEAAAKTWIERVKGLNKGQGKGNQPRH